MRVQFFPLSWAAVALLATLALGAQTGAGLAQAGRNCDSIKDDHAFNLCLAAQGPRRGAPRATAPAGTREAPAATRRGGTRTRRASNARLRGGIVIQRTRSGRVRMIIPGRRR